MVEESYAQVKRTVGALASAVRSGESWSEQLQTEYDEGLRALDAMSRHGICRAMTSGSLCAARFSYWLERTHGIRLYLGLLVFEIGLRPQRYRARWGFQRVR